MPSSLRSTLWGKGQEDPNRYITSVKEGQVEVGLRSSTQSLSLSVKSRNAQLARTHLLTSGHLAAWG